MCSHKNDQKQESKRMNIIDWIYLPTTRSSIWVLLYTDKGLWKHWNLRLVNEMTYMQNAKLYWFNISICRHVTIHTVCIVPSVRLLCAFENGTYATVVSSRNRHVFLDRNIWINTSSDAPAFSVLCAQRYGVTSCLYLQGHRVVMLGVHSSRIRANVTKQENSVAFWSVTSSRASHFVTAVLNFSYAKSNFFRYFIRFVNIYRQSFKQVRKQWQICNLKPELHCHVLIIRLHLLSLFIWQSF